MMRALIKEVCNVDLALHLRKLGFKAESFFMWEGFMLDENGIPTDWSLFARRNDYRLNKYQVPAYTIRELGEIMVEQGKRFFPYYCDQAEMQCWVYNFGQYPNYVSGKTEADCRASMLIYLIKNNLMKYAPTKEK